MSHGILLDNDNVIRLSGLVSGADGSYVNDATVTATLKTLAGVAINGCTGVSMTYVSGSNGRYQGTFSHNDLPSSGGSALTPGGHNLEITASSSSGYGFWDLLVDVASRTT